MPFPTARTMFYPLTFCCSTESKGELQATELLVVTCIGSFRIVCIDRQRWFTLDLHGTKGLIIRVHLKVRYSP